MKSKRENFLFRNKMAIRALLLFFFLTLFLSACFLSQEVVNVTVIDPDEVLVNRFPHPVVVSFSDAFEEEKASLYPDDESAEVNLGKKLKAALLNALSIAYEYVYLTDDAKVSEGISRVLQFAIFENQIVYADDLMRRDIEDRALFPLRLTVFSIAVTVKAYGNNYYRPEKKSVIRASSRFFRNTDKKKDLDEFQKAVDIVIQRISYDLANLLLQGYAEPGIKPQPKNLRNREYSKAIKEEE